ncbi:MAG: hypothetical protein HY296_07855 [Thaumarchaeota archaeon]|nr:hypothetical protein [Nitrososphaerota archaeon]
MNEGLWVWPPDPKDQRAMLRNVMRSKHLLQAMVALSKSKEGLSNAEIDDAIVDNSNWMTLWVVRQLTSLGFLNYNVHYFGEAAKYQLTELGKNVIPILTGQPASKPTAKT